MEINLEAPINSLSFGNVSYNFLRQFWRRNINFNLFPIGQKLDLKAFDKIDPELKSCIYDSIEKANLNVKRDVPALKLWHLNGSQGRIGSKQLLYSFYELDEPTDVEINLAKLQDKVVFSSQYASNSFKSRGVDCENIPIGFDEDFEKTNKKYLNQDIVHFGLMGKFEKRKHTEKIIKLWLSKYGNDRKYQLSICVTNPFIKPEDMQKILQECFGNKRYFNVNVLPYLETNSQVADLLNAIDIDLTGLSGAEGWNLPAFNATCLGKWSIVLNETSHKDWANEENSVLVQSSGKETAIDGLFFSEKGDFNKGNIYTWDSDIVSQAMDNAVSKKGQINTAGEKLKEQFSYEKTVDRIITELEAIS